MTRGKQIIAELKSVRNTSVALDEKAVQQLQDEFNGLPEFPERDQKYLFRDFNRAVEGLEKHRQSAIESAQAAEIQRLHHNAALCEQLEAMVGSSSENASGDIENVLAEWDDGEKTDKAQWKKAMIKRRETIVKQLQSNTAPDYEKNNAARKLLCIEMEILNDRETPVEDKQLRMQYQLERLQHGMSSAAAASPQAKAAELTISWLTAPPASPDLCEKLNTRFNSASGK